MGREKEYVTEKDQDNGGAKCVNCCVRTSDTHPIQIKGGKCGETYGDKSHTVFLYAKLNWRLFEDRNWLYENVTACKYVCIW